MYFDLNVPVLFTPTGIASQGQAQSKKGKGKQTANAPPPSVSYTPAQLAKIEARIDLLVRCAYFLPSPSVKEAAGPTR